jgi:tetratricopeptide (TPR) repeat protein
LFEEILAFDENYVGTYYHLGKLLERVGETKEAILIYEKGMQVAKIVKDNHSYNELAAALDNLLDE